LYDLQTMTTEEADHSYRGDSNGSPGKEVAGVVEGGEESDAEAAVGQGVEEAVAGGCQEEIGP
jgi:hypothetical protein